MPAALLAPELVLMGRYNLVMAIIDAKRGGWDFVCGVMLAF